MAKLARNEPCSCGSGKKYKKCCLDRGILLPGKASAKRSESALVKTLTDEFFQPMRLYYTIHDLNHLKENLCKLKCIDYNDRLDDWTLRYEAEAADMRLNIPHSKVPAEAQPLIIATITIEDEVTMFIDVRSIERAARLIEFVDKHVPRDAAEITYAGIYNKLITVPSQDPQAVRDVDYDDIFSEARIITINPEKFISDVRAISARYESKEEARVAALQETQNQAKKPLPEVERIPTHYYEEGIIHFETACKFRQMIAMQHYLGKTDYSFYDLTQDLFHKQSAV